VSTSKDWSRFTLRIDIGRSMADIFRAWVSCSALESWFLRKAVFTNPDGSVRQDQIMADDTYQWWWYGYPDEVVETGAILEISDDSLLRFSFGKAGIVSVLILEEENTSIVELTQNEIPTDHFARENYHLGCSLGWTFYLANLKSVLEGGPDLRNKNINLKNMVNS
jgi:uncharacterized protein YndB with AHSA1/START domain